MVISYNGLQYLVIDNSLVNEYVLIRKKVDNLVLEHDSLTSGYLGITHKQLETLVNVDQENLELFYGKYFETYKESRHFPYIIVDGKFLFYSNAWKDEAKKVKFKYVPENIGGIYYFPEELESSVYATHSMELFIVLNTQPIIPFYYHGEAWFNERNIPHIDILLPSDDMSLELRGHKRRMRLRAEHDKHKPFALMPMT